MPFGMDKSCSRIIGKKINNANRCSDLYSAYFDRKKENVINHIKSAGKVYIFASQTAIENKDEEIEMSEEKNVRLRTYHQRHNAASIIREIFVIYSTTMDYKSTMKRETSFQVSVHDSYVQPE